MFLTNPALFAPGYFNPHFLTIRYLNRFNGL